MFKKVKKVQYGSNRFKKVQECLGRLEIQFEQDLIHIPDLHNLANPSYLPDQFSYRWMELKQVGVPDQQHHQHCHLVHAHHHVCLLEAGQGAGSLPSHWQVPSTISGDGYFHNFPLMDLLLHSLNPPQHPLSLLLWACSCSLHSCPSYWLLHCRFLCLFHYLHLYLLWLSRYDHLHQEGQLPYKLQNNF